MSRLVDEIRSLFATTRTHKASVVESLSPTDISWVVRFSDCYGVAVPYLDNETVSERFHSARLSTRVIIIDGRNTDACCSHHVMRHTEMSLLFCVQTSSSQVPAVKNAGNCSKTHCAGGKGGQACWAMLHLPRLLMVCWVSSWCLRRFSLPARIPIDGAE